MWRIPSFGVARGGGAPASAVSVDTAPTDDTDHRAPARPSAVAAPPAAQPASGAALAGVAFRGSEATSAGSSSRIIPLPAELVALFEEPGAATAPEQRHLSVVADAFEREPEPGETCSCGRPPVVVHITERFGAVPSCKR